MADGKLRLVLKISKQDDSNVISLHFLLEDVIKRRLLIDADGTGDDRRLNVLMKSFIIWCNTSDTPENT